jgi:hypothetical protein
MVEGKEWDKVYEVSQKYDPSHQWGTTLFLLHNPTFAA